MLQKNGMSVSAASCYVNTGNGPRLSVLEIGLEDSVAVIEPDTGFWSIVQADTFPGVLVGSVKDGFIQHQKLLTDDMNYVRFGLRHSAVYFNPTERCNMNCTYCYLPESIRRQGKNMSKEEVCAALERLLLFFKETLPEDIKPQIIFHGSEPLMAKEAVFYGIERYLDHFQFGVQTNGTLLDQEAISFLTDNNISIGISLDGSRTETANCDRKNWQGKGFFDHIVKVIEQLSDYPALNVMSTITANNVQELPQLVDFYYQLGLDMAMFNPVRCTQPGGRQVKPDDETLLHFFCVALDRCLELYESTGKKVVIASFANIMAGILAPTGRKLMCDITPCGGGRCFFAVSALGDIYPCSEFIGIPEFNCGNLFTQDLKEIVQAKQMEAVKHRIAENIYPCSSCAIRHFCGAPCPAEVYMVTGKLNSPSPYCRFYEGLIRYAFRIIAQGKEEVFLWHDWQEETEELVQLN